MYLSFLTPLKSFFNTNIPHISLSWGRFLGSIAVLVLSYALRKYIVEMVLKVSGSFAKKTKTQIDDYLLEAVRPPLKTTVFYFGILIAIWILPVEKYPTIENIIYILFRIGAIFLLGWLLLRSVKVVGHLVEEVSGKTTSSLDNRLVPFVEQILKILITIIMVVMLMQELGYDPSGLLAGLGLGGLAFALAAQDTVSNFFGSLMILTDKPFQVGEWIKVGSTEGVVEQIGFRSTKIRQFDKSVVQVPNGKIASDFIQNFDKRDGRRIFFHVGITYQSSPDMMRGALNIINEIIQNHEEVKKDYYMVNFTEFGDSSLKIMVYCFSVKTAWAEYLRIQEQLMFKIWEEFNQHGIEFAYPTMTVHMAPDAPQGIEEKTQSIIDRFGAEVLREKNYNK
ncbi:MAG: mechanosensitive ion channel family protein [Myxococcota bacterium]